MELNQTINVSVKANNTPSAQYRTVILKPNVIDDVNTLTQAMMSQPNTKYVIKYDYVLGEGITIPANCVLQFDGGSISGEHTITGQNTGINAGLVKTFNTNVTLAGIWNVAEAYPEWFGAKGDGTTDDTTALMNVLKLSKKIIFRPNGTYKFYPDYQTKTLLSLDKHIIIGNNATINVYGGTEQNSLFFVDEIGTLLSAGTFTSIKDITINGVGSYDIPPSQSWIGSGIYTSNVVGVHIIGKADVNLENVHFKNLLFGVRSGENSEIASRDTILNVDKCSSDSQCLFVILSQRNKKVNIKNSIFDSQDIKNILVHTIYLSYNEDIFIDNCSLYHCGGPLITITDNYGKAFVSNCTANTDKTIFIADDGSKLSVFNSDFNTTGYFCYSNHAEVTLYDCVIKTESHLLNVVNNGEINKIKFDGCSIDFKELMPGAAANTRLSFESCEITQTNPTSGCLFRLSQDVSGAELVINNCKINEGSGANGVFAEIHNSINAKISNCSIKRNVTANWVLYPTASMFANMFMVNNIFYNHLKIDAVASGRGIIHNNQCWNGSEWVDATGTPV